MATNAELWLWFEKQPGIALLSDDAGRWVVPSGGFQPMVTEDALGGWWSYDIEAGDWRGSIREALLAAKEKFDAE